MNLVVDGKPLADASEGGGRRRPRLRSIDTFGSNPGALRMFVYEPTSLARHIPCVVVLHGCSQTAAEYDAASGWSRLAEESEFVVVYAEQQRRNNENTCFSWFQTGDVRRGGGEAESISQMVDYAVRDLRVDPDQVFVCGLSAGGAMAAAMLATYPERFAGGAIIAGLPFGAAKNMSEAFDAMFVGRAQGAAQWGDMVRSASTYTGPWPKVSIWYGTEDAVVRPINGGELVKQWTNVHGVGASEPAEDRVGPTTRRIWRDAAGKDCVVNYVVPGLGHGVPVAETRAPAPFFLPAGISSTNQIAADFGLCKTPFAPAGL